jgi:hypothetical protein
MEDGRWNELEGIALIASFYSFVQLHRLSILYPLCSILDPQASILHPRYFARILTRRRRGKRRLRHNPTSLKKPIH